MRHTWLFAAIVVMFMGACVPARKVVFLQKEDLKRRKQIPKDSVLRVHHLKILEYHIQPLDVLSVRFETLSEEGDGFDFLSRLSPQGGSSTSALNGIIVNREGEIEYAVLGKIKLKGLTTFQAEDSIRVIASRYLPNVIVRVRPLNFRYTVLGEVSGERTVISANTRLTMMEAIGQAGGLGELADRSNVKVIRQQGDHAEVYYVNLLEEKFIESPYYYVQQNDVIIVPPLRQRTFRKYFTGNVGIIASSLSFIFLIITLTR
jgi:polysaccharide export outer membrane protein